MIDTFDRARFEKALGFLPLGAKFIGAGSGQLEYLVPVCNKLRCGLCGAEFYPPAETRSGIYHEVTCPKCGKRAFVEGLIPGEVSVKVYSSIDPITGVCRESGDDSIRLVMVGHKGKPLGKIDNYTTRIAGWEERLKNKFRIMWKIAQTLPRCPKCHHVVGWNVCKSGQNKGRMFARCWGCNVWIGWKDE